MRVDTAAAVCRPLHVHGARRTVTAVSRSNPPAPSPASRILPVSSNISCGSHRMAAATPRPLLKDMLQTGSPPVLPHSWMLCEPTYLPPCQLLPGRLFHSLGADVACMGDRSFPWDRACSRRRALSLRARHARVWLPGRCGIQPLHLPPRSITLVGSCVLRQPLAECIGLSAGHPRSGRSRTTRSTYNCPPSCTRCCPAQITV